jgi:AcrR family transcriptional regulator
VDGGGLPGVLPPSDQAERKPDRRGHVMHEPLAFGLVRLLQDVAEDDEPPLARDRGEAVLAERVPLLLRPGQPAQPDRPSPDRPSPGRTAQRRRTRRAIVEATSRLLAAGADPSINDIAAAADVSRRTIYTYFPTLDQLLLDATIGAMNVSVEAAIDAPGEPDARARIAALIAVLSDGMTGSLPLGRKLIKLTVDAPPSDAEPKRGYRRIGWIETALEPVRPRLGPDRFERLVSALAVVIGWEAFVVLFDVRGLTADQAREVITGAALTLLDAALAQAGTDRDSPN